MHPVTATAAYVPAIDATAALLSKLRLECAFTGAVARSAWLGSEVSSGSIDALALLSPQQKNQVATMGSNRGFVVDRDEIEASEELDLIPMRYDGIRVHILVASNALYGRMVADGVAAAFHGSEVRVPRMEDFALLLQLSDDVMALRELTGSPEFDRAWYNSKLKAIGLQEVMLPE